MKRLAALSLLSALLLTGCGVKQEIYQEEVLRAREAEAVSEDLSIQLAGEQKKSAQAEGDLSAARARIAEVEKDLDLAKKSTGETGERLDACIREKESVLASFDAAKKTILDSDRDAKELRARIEKQKAEIEAARKSCDEKIESMQALAEKARGRITSMEAERSVLLEEKEKLQREKKEKVEELSATYEGLLKGMKTEMEKTSAAYEERLKGMKTEMESTYEGLLLSMKSEIEKGQVTISNLQGRLTVNVVDEILFPSGSAVVKEEGRAVLKRVAEALSGLWDKAIIIEGHTDNVPIGEALAARFPTNWELSAARAVSVVRYLAEAGKIDPRRLSAAGFGENRPVAPNDTPEGKAKNRRIEIKLVPLDPELAKELAPAPAEKTEEAAPQQETPPQGEAAEKPQTSPAEPAQTPPPAGPQGEKAPEGAAAPANPAPATPAPEGSAPPARQ